MQVKVLRLTVFQEAAQGLQDHTLTFGNFADIWETRKQLVKYRTN